MKDTAAVIVHYETPDLTRAAVWSLRTQYPSLPIVLVNNGSSGEGRRALDDTASEAGGVDVLHLQKNLHHGPGMHRGIMHTQSEWVLLFDSDCIAYRTGFVEKMRAELGSDGYMAGPVCFVDPRGFNTGAADPEAFPYVHPQCALLRRLHYTQLPPFERHGAPCLANERAAVARGFKIRDFNTAQYVLHIGRGTVSRHGYRLGISGIIETIRRKIRF